MASAAQLAKEQGNEAFKAHDFDAARASYSRAMELDPAEFVYPLNRSMANLKLQRYASVGVEVLTYTVDTLCD